MRWRRHRPSIILGLLSTFELKLKLSSQLLWGRTNWEETLLWAAHAHDLDAWVIDIFRIKSYLVTVLESGASRSSLGVKFGGISALQKNGRE